MFCNLMKGWFGYGFYMAPPMLLFAAWCIAFHREHSVGLRLFSILSIPVILGAMFHLLLVQDQIAFGARLLLMLWDSGLELASGGIISGLLAILLRYAFSTVGAMVVLLAVGTLVLLQAFNRGPGDVWNYLKELWENRPQYEKKISLPLKQSTIPRPVPHLPEKKRDIDIALDGMEREYAVIPSPSRQKGLFNRVPSVPTPDQVLCRRPEPVLPPEEPVTHFVIKPPKESPQTVSPPPAVLLQTEEPPSVSTEEEPGWAELEQSVFDEPIFDEPVDWQWIDVPSHVRMPEAEIEMPPILREPAVEGSVRKEPGMEQSATQEESPEPIRSVYRYPPLALLSESGRGGTGPLHTSRQRLEGALQSFGVNAHIAHVTCGPSVTLYELELEQGVKLSKITNLSNDIALALGAQAVRIAPVRDKIATVGIEVPNRQVATVGLRDVIGSDAFARSPSHVSFAIGKDIGGHPVVGNIAGLPHLLIAGTTGSGKSVCINALIISLLYKATPDEVRMIMVDPKMVELGMYHGIPHLLIPVVTDPKKAAGALQWAVNEMMRRYRAFSELGVKDLASYNSHTARREDLKSIPQVVVILDELADLMLVAAREVEESICRIAQMGRAAGIHLVIATQRPSADVITGLMKANIPSRIAFKVASSLESRIILDCVGAEKLVGKGDMLYRPVGEDQQRVQGCFVSEEEVAAVVDFIKESCGASYDEEVLHEIERHAHTQEKGSKSGRIPADPEDELLPAAIDVVMEAGQASASMLQRRLKLGHGRAARLLDQMEEQGVVGPFEGSRPRQVLIPKEQWQEKNHPFVEGTPTPSEHSAERSERMEAAQSSFG